MSSKIRNAGREPRTDLSAELWKLSGFLEPRAVLRFNLLSVMAFGFILFGIWMIVCLTRRFICFLSQNVNYEVILNSKLWLGDLQSLSPFILPVKRSQFVVKCNFVSSLLRDKRPVDRTIRVVDPW